MKYLSLKHNELKELLHLRTPRFIACILILCLVGIASYLLLSQILEPFLNRLLITFFIVIYLVYAYYVNQRYIKEIICKQKKVFHGVLSRKSISQGNKRRRYVFNMDGRIFYVNKSDFDCMQEGDMVEFHVSSYGKHLFRVERLNEAI